MDWWEKIRNLVESLFRDAANFLEKDGSVTPVYFVLSDTIDIVSGLSEDGSYDAKRAGETVGKFAAMKEAYAVIQITESWTVRRPCDGAVPTGEEMTRLLSQKPSEAPDRIEELTAVVILVDGRHNVYRAEILRNNSFTTVADPSWLHQEPAIMAFNANIPPWRRTIH